VHHGTLVAVRVGWVWRHANGARMTADERERCEAVPLAPPGGVLLDEGPRVWLAATVSAFRRRFPARDRRLALRAAPYTFPETGSVARIVWGPLGRNAQAADLLRYLAGRNGVPLTEQRRP
jgi:hypothetical protein